MRFFIYFLSVLCFCTTAQAAQIIVDVQTKSINRTEISEQAVQKAMEQFLKDFLTEEKYSKLEKELQKEIFPLKNRFILYVKIGKSVMQEDESYLTDVTIGFSENNLQTLLVQNNLYYDSFGTSCVLPAIIFKITENNKSETYKWWQDDSENNKAQKLNNSFYYDLNRNLIENSFYNINPSFNNLTSSLPNFIVPSSNRSSHFIKLSEFLNCHILLSGDIEVTQNNEGYFAEFSLASFHIDTKQKLLDFNNTIPLDLKKNKTVLKAFQVVTDQVLKSIMFQLAFYKDQGELNLYRTTISIQGPVNYKEKEILRQYFIKYIPSIKNLQEQIISSDKIVYEAKISGKMSNVARDLNKRRGQRFYWQVVGYNKNSLNIYAKKK